MSVAGSASAQAVEAFRLSHDLAPGVNVIDFAPSPDGRHVAYTTQGGVGQSELWLASIDGAVHTKVAEGNVTGEYLPAAPALRFSTDGSTLVFGISTASGTTVGVTGLGVYDIVGGGPSEVLVPTLPQGNATTITSYQLSADGQVVVYQAENTATRELYRVRVGQAPEVINRPLVSNGRVMQFALVGAPARIVYSADDVTDERYEIYSLPLLGTVAETIKLSHPTGDNRTSTWGSFSALGASHTIQFGSRLLTETLGVTFVVPVDGSQAPRELFPADHVVAYSTSSRDGLSVVYSTYSGTPGIYVVPVSGPAGSRQWVASNAKSVHDMRFVDRDAFVVWKEWNIDPYDGGVKAAALPPATPATTTLVAAGDPVRFGFDHSPRYFFVDSAYRLVSANLETGEPPIVLDTTPSYINGQGATLTTDGSLLIYLDEMPDTVIRVVPAGGPESAVVRIDHQPTAGAALAFKLSSDGHSVVYRWSGSTQIELYVADIAVLLPAPAERKVYLPTLIR